jgi:ubiquinone/menaquinone biosynthesis C-methylase UbiE
MDLATPERNKEIYQSLHDAIIAKRFESDAPIRRHAHRMQYQVFVDAIPAGSTVLDAGCGEGVLSVLLAQKGCIVTGFDISAPNIEAAKKYAASCGMGERISFLLGDTERIPVADRSFDYVVSSHVLEHVPDFVQGARELSRIAKKQVFIAIPTCMSLGAFVLLAHDKYWVFSRRSFFALPYGLLRVFAALLSGREGVNEGYEGRPELIHIWRFPWRGRRLIERGNLRVVRYGCSAIVFPYLTFLLPVSRFLERMAWLPFIRNFGHGTTYVCEPLQAS